MAHFVVESDAQGNVLDCKVYCSDSCARTNPSYGGWFGAQEVEFTTYCSNEVCNELIKGIGHGLL